LNSISRLVITLMMAVIIAGCSGNSENGAKPTLKYSAIPDQNTTELIQRFAPLTEYLAQQLGVPVEYVPARDYQASVEMFRNGDIQLAWFGGLTGVQARAAVPGAQAIAQGKADPHYYSYFIANSSTGLDFSPDFPASIADMSFTFGSESSTSGRLMPEFFIKENTGKTPDQFFSQPFGFSGSNDKTCELVESGRFQTGVVNYNVYDRRVANGELDKEVCRVIWTTPFYADYNFTVHPDLEKTYGEGFSKKLQEVLINITDQELLSALPREKLIPARNEEFLGIEAVARELGMLR